MLSLLVAADGCRVLMGFQCVCLCLCVCVSNRERERISQKAHCLLFWWILVLSCLDYLQSHECGGEMSPHVDEMEISDLLKVKKKIWGKDKKERSDLDRFRQIWSNQSDYFKHKVIALVHKYLVCIYILLDDHSWTFEYCNYLIASLSV